MKDLDVEQLSIALADIQNPTIYSKIATKLLSEAMRWSEKSATGYALYLAYANDAYRKELTRQR